MTVLLLDSIGRLGMIPWLLKVLASKDFKMVAKGDNFGGGNSIHNENEISR